MSAGMEYRVVNKLGSPVGGRDAVVQSIIDVQAGARWYDALWPTLGPHRVQQRECRADWQEWPTPIAKPGWVAPAVSGRNEP